MSDTGNRPLLSTLMGRQGKRVPMRANSRQELCETLEYFRAYQGGVYSHQGRARGYLLGGHPAKNDASLRDGQVIISHGGGSSGVDDKTGQTVLIMDQTDQSPSVNALMNAFESKEPVVLIASHDYALLPFSLEEYAYVVLGSYWITRSWVEPEQTGDQYFMRKKFSFQWVQTQGRPWWLPEPFEPIIDRGHLTGRAPLETCPSCRKDSPVIFDEWTCTQTGCQEFYAGGNFALFSKYDTTRLEGLLSESAIGGVSTTNWGPIYPILGKYTGREGQTPDISQMYARAYWSGWCCPCGRINCKEYWTEWKCAECRETFGVGPFPILDAIDLAEDALAARVPAQDIDEFGERSQVRSKETFPIEIEGYRVEYVRYTLNQGSVYHLPACPSEKERCDVVFRQYQVDANGGELFKRYGRKAPRLRGQMLSQYFSHNAGVFYKYVAGTDNTVPLDSFESVREAMDLIESRATRVLEGPPVFNELLSVAYLGDQKMNFHSDGEQDLGPVVSSLSLGASATMTFREVPGKYKKAGAAEGQKPPVFLSLHLEHGDVVIMDGKEVQEHYQHMVEPHGFRIVATARLIEAS